jgi:DHA1 family bicyclomycin/chloramphenicol resistance-like MFS transporter
MQQVTGATGGYLVGLVPHDGAANLGWMMLAFTLLAVAAQWALRQR